MQTLKFDLNQYNNKLHGELTIFLNEDDLEKEMLLVVPGGGYDHLSIRENLPVVNRFLKENINVASLKYSVFPYHYPTLHFILFYFIIVFRSRLMKRA